MKRKIIFRILVCFIGFGSLVYGAEVPAGYTYAITPPLSITFLKNNKVLFEDLEKEPASEKTAKKMAERIEKDLGKNARRAFHDLKDGCDRTMQELKQDAADIYEQYGNGKEHPQWMRPD